MTNTRHLSTFPLEERFFAKVMKTPLCWLWTAARTKNGHGVFGTGGGTSTSAHRWSYEYHLGPIPDGLQVDHLCRVTRCVNPAHLEAVTGAENVRRALRARDITAYRKRVIDLSWPGWLGEFSPNPAELDVA